MSASAVDLRVVVADDAALIREALVGMLAAAGISVVAAVGDAVSAHREAVTHQPHCVVMDIRMPPGNTTDGINAALRIWDESPEVGVLLLSQHVELAYVATLLTKRAFGFGYLLKERVGGSSDFIDAVRRVAEGGIVLDPDLVSAAMNPPRTDPLAQLSQREREALALLAEGYSNRGIAKRLFVSERTVEGYVSRIQMLLGLQGADDVNRRVLAVLRYLDVIES